MQHTHIKICGLTDVDEVIDTVEAGADAIGLNFYPKSSRYIPPEHAREVANAIPSSTLAVGLFIATSWQSMIDRVNNYNLSGLQLYGLPEASLQSYVYIAAFRVRDVADLPMIQQFVHDHQPNHVLIDAHVEGAMGGTGHVAPWELLEGFDPGVPMILAGGLTPQNVAEAIRRVRPWGVDVASGVESSPGRKDPEKVRRFNDAVRSAL